MLRHADASRECFGCPREILRSADAGLKMTSI